MEVRKEHVMHITVEEAAKMFHFSSVKKMMRLWSDWLLLGWERGSGRNDCTGCVYETDGICMYIADEHKRRPCPPWDCSVYKPGRRKPQSVESKITILREDGGAGDDVSEV